jgi:hypothetical protein
VVTAAEADSIGVAGEERVEGEAAKTRGAGEVVRGDRGRIAEKHLAARSEGHKGGKGVERGRE